LSSSISLKRRATSNITSRRERADTRERDNTEMTVAVSTPVRTAPSSPLKVDRTLSALSTSTTQSSIVYGAPGTNSSISYLFDYDSYYEDGDLLGLGDLSFSYDDDTEPSTCDDISNSNNSHMNKSIFQVSDGVTSEEDKIFENAKGFRPIIYSYLRKLGRNGKWQRRFFECDGASLTYYKTEKRKKHLATLDLAKVGSIAISAEDESGCTFHIQVADRPYSLKAESESVCVDWVITLNRIKEARMQIGRVKLVTPKLPALLLAPSTDEKEENYKLNEENDVCAAPRMILEANRPRTRGVDKSQWQEIMASETGNTTNTIVPEPAQRLNEISSESLNFKTKQNLAVWEKPSTFERIRERIRKKVLTWARSIRNVAINCRSSQSESVVLGETTENDNVV